MALFAEILILYNSKPRVTGIMLMAGQADNHRTKIFLRVEDHFGEFITKDIAEIIVSIIRINVDCFFFLYKCVEYLLFCMCVFIKSPIYIRSMAKLHICFEIKGLARAIDVHF